MKRRTLLQSGLAIALTAGPALARAPFTLAGEPLPLLSPPLEDDQGRALTLGSFAGRIIVLNIWATWCPPCRDEMPTLDALQGLLGGEGFAVVPVAIDAGGIAVARQFYRDIGIRNLGLYWGDDMRVKLAFGVIGLPTTVLIDRKGRELGRVTGPAVWDGPQAVAQIARVIAEN